MPSTKDTQLRNDLIEAAKELFSKQGYGQTSLRQIADKAGVSHGSVRYHFGTKKKLYRASIERFEPEAIGQQFPHIPSKMTQEQAKELLREYIFTLSRIKAHIGGKPQLAVLYVEGEGTLGSRPDAVFYKRVIKPGHDALRRIVQAIRPDITDEETLEIVVFNIIAQCVMLRIGRGVILTRLEKRTLSKKDVNAFAQRIYEMSLFGIEGLS